MSLFLALLLLAPFHCFVVNTDEKGFLTAQRILHRKELPSTEGQPIDPQSRPRLQIDHLLVFLLQEPHHRRRPVPHPRSHSHCQHHLLLPPVQVFSILLNPELPEETQFSDRSGRPYSSLFTRPPSACQSSFQSFPVRLPPEQKHRSLKRSVPDLHGRYADFLK